MEGIASALLLGCGFALAAALQPGPLQAFLLASVARRGWRRTLPACLSPLFSDGPVAVLTLVVLHEVPPVLLALLRAAGGGFLLFLAGRGLQTWRRARADAPGGGPAEPSSLLQATLVNLLNPNPFLGWTLVLGPAVLAAWRRGHGQAVALLAAFYGTMIAALAGTIVLFGGTGLLEPRGRRALLLASNLALALLGGWQLVLAAEAWRAG